MAVSAFKSTSKRGNLGTTSCNNPTISSSSCSAREGNLEDLGKKGVIRRSRSVSALSRTSSSSSIVDFLNKRDNPLFCSSGSTSSSPPDLLESECLNGVAKFDYKVSKFNVSPTKSEENCVSGDNRRGRSVIRNSDNGNKFGGGGSKELGRSLSTVDRGRGLSTVDRGRGLSTVDRGRGLSTADVGRRRRSVSRGRYENSEKKVNNVSSSVSTRSNRAKTPQTWSSQHPHSEPSEGFASCVQAMEWEDGISTSSFSEAEEKTIKAVSEQMKSFEGDHPAGDAGIYETVRSEVRRAISEIQNDLENVIQRKNPSIIASANVVDIPPELVNPDAIELVSEIRSEYALKLQQSQERARKLRADLAVEEHRGMELGRILDEILPEPKNVQTQRSRPRRKNSVERWKMSKRLTEEAMNYFDECVSISTFDSSDFSSPEDQPAAAPPASDNKVLPSTSSTTSANSCVNGHISQCKESNDQVQSTLDHQASDLIARSSTKDKEPVREEDKVADADTASTRNFQFSFAGELNQTVGVHDDIRNYIKKFEKEIKEDGRECRAVKSNYYDAGDYEELQFLDERLLFDKVILKSRIKSGGLHLCATGITL